MILVCSYDEGTNLAILMNNPAASGRGLKPTGGNQWFEIFFRVELFSHL